MFSNKAVIVLCISMLNFSWIQAMPDGREAVEHDGRLSLFNDVAKWSTQKPTLKSTTGKDRSSDVFSSRLMTSPTNHYFPEEGSGSGSTTLTPGDDFSEVISPSPVTTTEDFTFAEPSSTTVANDKASEKIGGAGENIPRVEIIVVPICAVIMLVFVIFVIKKYYLPGNASREIYITEEPLITKGKMITT
uniref:Uncharacterized protein n=1 Tax=Glyptapanteles flavicoxis TaxID=463051 RepID=B7S850_9HYME|nr:conserved hypothetical protein [Glyptapanteles flavicoxis]